MVCVLAIGLVPMLVAAYLVADYALTRHIDDYRKLPYRDLSNLTDNEWGLICEVVSRPHFGMSSTTELYFDRYGDLVFDINTGRTRDTWPYREALRQKCPDDQPDAPADNSAPVHAGTGPDAPLRELEMLRARKLPNRDLSNLTDHELGLICEVVSRPHFGMSSTTELYFDRYGDLVFDINTARTRDTWPYRDALREKCPGGPFNR